MKREFARRIIKSLLQPPLRRFGYDIGQIDGTFSLARHLPALFDALRIDCVLDVGAHWGEYGRMLRVLGYRGRIVSFEPIAENFARLESERRGDALWDARQMALGAADGEQTIHVTRATDFSSFLTPNDYARERFGADTAVVQGETVVVRRLDGILPELTGGKSARVYLKMDTQGYDMEVVRGAAGSLPSIFAFQSELPVKPLYDGMPPYTRILEEYQALGYGLTGMFPVSRDGAAGHVIEFDCVMARAAS